MPANVQTMAYVGKKPWHELGTKVEQAVHADAMIRAAGLDWEVIKRPARGSQPIRKLRDGRELYPRYEIVRMPRANRKEQEIVLGMVRDRYEPLQNQEAFTFFDEIVDREVAFFETAGVLGEGERVWVMAKMPDAIQVVRNDECHKYLLLSNTHTGQGSVIVKFTAIRVVCQNTLMLAMDDGQPAFRVRHSKLMAERLQQISELIALATAVYSGAAKLFQRLARVQLKKDLLDRYLESVLPKTDAQKKKGDHPPKWTHVLRLLDEVPDLQSEGVRGTMWAAYNAITRFEDYRIIDHETGDARLDRVWFGGGADLKLQALQKASDLVKAI